MSEYMDYLAAFTILLWIVGMLIERRIHKRFYEEYGKIRKRLFTCDDYTLQEAHEMIVELADKAKFSTHKEAVSNLELYVRCKFDLKIRSRSIC